MCGITSEQVIEEARAARDAGDMPRYAMFTQVLLDEYGFTVEEIKKRMGDDRSSPVQQISTGGSRDPRLPIPESEWSRPRLGFAI